MVLEPPPGVEPLFWHCPEGVGSAGDEAVDLARMAGLELDAWQQWLLRATLLERPDGNWACPEVGVEVPRQNGKGAYIEALELAGLFLIGDPLQIHSAHLFPTSGEGFRRITSLIQSTPELDRRVKSITTANGKEGIELTSGERLLFKARGGGAIRGFSGNRVFLDEAMVLKTSMMADIMPALSAIPNPQIVYTGSAVDRMVHQDGIVFSRLRHRGRARDSKLFWVEWGLPFDSPDDVPASVAADEASWRAANPAYGIRIDRDFTDTEHRSLPAREFAVERLGVGDWWPVGEDVEGLLPVDQWRALEDSSGVIVGDVVFGFEVRLDRSSAAVAVAGWREDGLPQVELVEWERGTGWLVDRVEELVREHSPLGVAADGVGAAGSSVLELRQRGVDVKEYSTRDFVRACSGFYDGVVQGLFRHLGGDGLLAAVRAAERRELSGAWGWNRRVPVDVSPLVAVTVAYNELISRRVSGDLYLGDWD